MYRFYINFKNKQKTIELYNKLKKQKIAVHNREESR